MEKELITAEIERLKKEKNAIILAHYYSHPDIQDICDFLGDSLELSRKAAETNAELILFCGVNFMAETASVVSKGKKVIVPDDRAGCSLAESIDKEDLISWKQKNPDGVVISYVNTTAEVKAYSDICCTSSNAVKVLNSVPEGKKILFTPDKNLGAYLKYFTGREMEIWHGDCCVHDRFGAELVFKMKEDYPSAEILIHPESSCSGNPVIHTLPGVFFYSTSGMLRHIENSEFDTFVILTEKEIIHQMEKHFPEKRFIPAGKNAICGQMKRNTLEKVLAALQREAPEIRVPDELASRAIIPVKRMLEL
jgi:quinolinate synthase